jgi:hypothetical protein
MDYLKLIIDHYSLTDVEVDLLHGTFRLERGGYEPDTAIPGLSVGAKGEYGPDPVFSGFSPVAEVYNLIAMGSPEEIVAGEAAIHQVFEQARQFVKDPLDASSAWLGWSTDREPGSESAYQKRALILNGGLRIKQPAKMRGGFVDPALYAELAILRHPFFENPSYTQVNNLATSVLGGKFTITDIPGSVPARISELIVLWSTGGPVVRGWFGIRPNYDGSANFKPVWELETTAAGSGHAYYHYTDVSNTSESGTSNSYRATCTFGTSTDLVKRVSVKLEEVDSAHAEEYIGRYLVLARCMVTAGEVGIQLKHGLKDGSFIPAEEVYIDHTSYQLIPLGTIQIPPLPRYNVTNYSNRLCELQVWAEQVSGAGSLYLDCLVLIPADHLMYFDGADISASGDTARIVTNERDHTWAWGIGGGGGYLNNSIEYHLTDWYLPRGDSVGIFAGERSTSHVITDACNLQLYYYPRWRLYRGE